MSSQEDAGFGYPLGIAMLPVLCHLENMEPTQDGLQFLNHTKGLTSQVLGTCLGFHRHLSENITGKPYKSTEHCAGKP